MLFLKPKIKSDEIMPPPPPSLATGIQKEMEDPKFFDEAIKPEDEQFKNFVKDLDEQLKQKEATLKKQKIPKKPKQFKKIAIKQVKDKKAQAKIKAISKEKSKKAKSNALVDLKKDFGLKELELKKLEESSKKDVELPYTSDEFKYGNFEKEIDQGLETKPKEILEAENEIKTAIDSIKYQERPSLFKRLFTKTAKSNDFPDLGDFPLKEKIEEKVAEEPLMIGPKNTDGISVIQKNIQRSREALMRFDLEAAKINYIEIMRIYNGLKPEEQAKIYHEIKELYFERKNAEGLKV